MKLNWLKEKRKAQPDAWRVASVVDERLHNAVLNGTLSEMCAMRRHYGVDLAALSLVIAYRAVNGDRTMTSDEIEGYADLTMTMLNHSGDTDNKGTPISVWDNIHVLYGIITTPLSFAKLYRRFGMDYKVIDLICTPKYKLQRILGKFSSAIEQMIKYINIIACEDLAIPNPDEDGLRNFIANTIEDIDQPHWNGPKARMVDIVIKYYLCDHPIETLTEMFKLPKRTIQYILQCWRHRVTFILDNPDTWYAYPSFRPFIFGNSQYNTECPEFSFLHRIRFLMMHRTEMSRTDNNLLKLVMGKLKGYNIACMVNKEENNE